MGMIKTVKDLKYELECMPPEAPVKLVVHNKQYDFVTARLRGDPFAEMTFFPLELNKLGEKVSPNG